LVVDVGVDVDVSAAMPPLLDDATIGRGAPNNPDNDNDNDVGPVDVVAPAFGPNRPANGTPIVEGGDVAGDGDSDSDGETVFAGDDNANNPPTPTPTPFPIDDDDDDDDDDEEAADAANGAGVGCNGLGGDGP
jgi:hypothetical protein